MYTNRQPGAAPGAAGAIIAVAAHVKVKLNTGLSVTNGHTLISVKLNS